MDGCYNYIDREDPFSCTGRHLREQGAHDEDESFNRFTRILYPEGLNPHIVQHSSQDQKKEPEPHFLDKLLKTLKIDERSHVGLKEQDALEMLDCINQNHLGSPAGGGGGECGGESCGSPPSDHFRVLESLFLQTDMPREEYERVISHAYHQQFTKQAYNGLSNAETYRNAFEVAAAKWFHLTPPELRRRKTVMAALKRLGLTPCDLCASVTPGVAAYLMRTLSRCMPDAWRVMADLRQQSGNKACSDFAKLVQDSVGRNVFDNLKAHGDRGNVISLVTKEEPRESLHSQFLHQRGELPRLASLLQQEDGGGSEGTDDWVNWRPATNLYEKWMSRYGRYEWKDQSPDHTLYQTVLQRSKSAAHRTPRTGTTFIPPSAMCEGDVITWGS